MVSTRRYDNRRNPTANLVIGLAIEREVLACFCLTITVEVSL